MEDSDAIPPAAPLDESADSPVESAPTEPPFRPAIEQPGEDDSPAATNSTLGSPAETLQPLIEKAASSRLSPQDEEQAASSLRGLLLGRKEDLPTAVAAMPKLGWGTTVKAVMMAWPEMKVTAKSGF